MQGQGSTGVNMSTSEENEQLSIGKKLVLRRKTHPGYKETREIAGAYTKKRFEMMFPEGQLRTASERAGFVRTVSKEMYCTNREDVDDGLVNFIASCREYTLSRTHLTSTQRLVMLLMSKLSVITKFINRHSDPVNIWRQNQSLGGHIRKPKPVCG